MRKKRQIKYQASNQTTTFKKRLQFVYQIAPA